VTAERARHLDRAHRRLAAGGITWARRRGVAGIAARRLAWRARVAAGAGAKRVLDLLGGLALLLLAAPVLALAALAIVLEDGRPVLFRQVRVGRHGRPFTMYKLRSMVRDAERRKAELLAHNEYGGPHFKIRRDPRVTQVGRVCRKFSVDELPQLFNVLLGDMSLVGPRPPLPSEVVHYDPAERRRLGTTPGITGLWQVSGRNEIDFQGQVRLDVQYIERRTLAMDLAILARTVPVVLSGKGAS
jgi:lipopolysaccharide/colanic/teichoic acid biosynthesis glycosyltransferase